MRWNVFGNFTSSYVKEEIIPVVLYQFDDQENYMDFVTKTIYGLIYEDCAKFYANDYYSVRNVIEDTMYKSVTQQYNDKVSGITVYNVQLKNIIFPQPFVEIISAKQHLVQEIQTQYNNRTTLLIDANSTLIQAIQQAQIINIQAQNVANLALINANATSSNIHNKYKKIGDTLLNVKSQFDFNTTELIKYIYAQYAKTGTMFAAV